jgi:hypothetical protein
MEFHEFAAEVIGYHGLPADATIIRSEYRACYMRGFFRGRLFQAQTEQTTAEVRTHEVEEVEEADE